MEKITILKFVQQPTIGQWRYVFFICAAVYIIAATVYNIYGSGERQPWDDPEKDHLRVKSKEVSRKVQDFIKDSKV